MVYTTSSYSGMDLNTEAGRQSAFVTMTLMQMVADAYEGAQEIWDKNSRREMVEGDDPQLFGPNEAQKGILEWLTHAKFLPPIPLTQVPTPAIEYPGLASNTTPRSKNILGVRRLTTSPKPIRSGTANSSPLPQSPVSPFAPKTFLDKIRRKSTCTVSTLPEPDASIPSRSCPSPARSRSSTLSSPVHLKTRPFIRPRRFSYKKRIRDLKNVESDVIKSSDALSSPRLAHSQAIKLGTIDADTLAQLGFCFPTSPSQPRPRERKPIHEKCTKDDEDDQPDVTLWTLFVVTALIYLFFIFLFLACVFVGLCRLIRECLFWNDGE